VIFNFSVKSFKTSTFPKSNSSLLASTYGPVGLACIKNIFGGNTPTYLI